MLDIFYAEPNLAGNPSKAIHWESIKNNTHCTVFWLWIILATVSAKQGFSVLCKYGDFSRVASCETVLCPWHVNTEQKWEITIPHFQCADRCYIKQLKVLLQISWGMQGHWTLWCIGIISKGPWQWQVKGNKMSVVRRWHRHLHPNIHLQKAACFFQLK